jgi:hypothetical protein
MGTSRSVAELEAKLKRLPKEMSEANEVAARRIGQFGKTQFLRQAQADNRGKLTMRNVGKRGIKLGVSYKIDGPPERKTLEFKPSSGRIGWRILQGGAKPHVITSKYAGGSRKSRANRVEAGQPLLRGGGRGGRAVLKIGGQSRRWVKHPGVKAKKTWTKASDVVAKDIALKEYRDQVRSKLAKVF